MNNIIEWLFHRILEIHRCTGRERVNGKVNVVGDDNAFMSVTALIADIAGQ